MALKRRFSLQIRLFLPIAALLWTSVIAVGIISYKREKEYRREVLMTQLEVFNTVLMSHYTSESEMKDYLNYMEDYFNGTPLEDVLVAVYDAHYGTFIDKKGYAMHLPDATDIDNDGLIDGHDLEEMTTEFVGYSPDELFYMNSTLSPDSTIVIRTVMPYNGSIAKAIKADFALWLIIGLFLIGITAVAYITTRHITRNIKLLKDFADRAANDRDFMIYSKFPNDELGEISRQIIHIYNARSAANAAREHEHNTALHAIEERAKLKRQLTNNISHELKTPVGIIKGYLDTIMDTPDMDESARHHFLVKAQQQANRLTALLNDLSTMTRLEESQDAISTEPVDFHELVASTIEEVELSGLAGQMEVKMAVPFDCTVIGNKALLSAMLHNLIKNAAFYSKGTEINIKCIETSDNHYTFIFYDDGVGVPPESIAHLFERFYRVDTGRSRRNGGTGLGLPIVKSTINALGGTITVANREGGGLQFTFTLKRPAA